MCNLLSGTDQIPLTVHSPHPSFDAYVNREVVHYVLLSRNVNMQRIGLTFKLQEIFDIAHYDSIIKECVHI